MRIIEDENTEEWRQMSTVKTGMAVLIAAFRSEGLEGHIILSGIFDAFLDGMCVVYDNAEQYIKDLGNLLCNTDFSSRAKVAREAKAIFERMEKDGHQPTGRDH